MKHLLDNWDEVSQLLGEKHILLFLDFDGTLAPLAPTPDEAELPPETRSLIKLLAARERCTVVVVSGRSLDDLVEKVGVEGIIYVGNHGLEARGSRALPVYTPPRAVREMLDLLRIDLAWRLKDIPGVLFEDKGVSVAVHYRLVDSAHETAVESAVRASLAALDIVGLLEIAPGKKVLELRQRLGWNKGSAVSWLVYSEEHRRSVPVYSIYVGDDVSDEDGFRALARKGVGVLVGEPRQSNASYYLRSTEEVFRLLRLMTERCGATV